MKPLTWRARALAATLAFGLPACAHATESGGTSKVLGVDTILSGVMPPPGLMVKTVAVAYDADRTLAGDGNSRPGIGNFDLRVRAAGVHFQYVWPGARFAGAEVMTSVATGYIDSRISFDVSTPVGRIHRRDAAKGLTDTLFGPVLLGWRGTTFHQIAGLQFSLPTGSFDRAKLANPGRGYSVFVPNYAMTWFPVERAEVSASAFYLHNRTNGDTGYRSGRELIVDYGLAWQARPGLQVGASGYLYQQVSDDIPNGPAIPGGNRGQVVAIGPFVRFHGKGWGVTAKWQRETLVENRASGDRILLQSAWKL